MLQVAFGGYYLKESNLTEFVENPVYYEPGFNIMSPIEMEVTKADRFYILLRKRGDNKGLAFNVININDLTVITKDVTNGEDVPNYVKINDLYTPWNNLTSFSSSPSAIEILLPIVLTIDNSLDINDPVVRVRVIDCSIRDRSDNTFIIFRVILNDEDKSFNYIPIELNDIANRNTYTASDREAKIKIHSASDYYILISPYAYLRETTKEKSDFSYPLDTIFYRRQNTFNNEDFSFSISSYSDSFLEDLISVNNIPSYSKVGIVTIDNLLYKYLNEQVSTANIDVSINGRLSGISDTFKIYFSR